MTILWDSIVLIEREISSSWKSVNDRLKKGTFLRQLGVRNPFAICSQSVRDFRLRIFVQQSDEHNGARWLLWNDSTITSDHSKASQTDDHTFRMNHSKFELNHLKNWNHSAIQIVETIQIIRTFLQFEHLIRCYSILVDGESMLLDTELYHSLGSRRGSHFWKTKKTFGDLIIVGKQLSRKGLP